MPYRRMLLTAALSSLVAAHASLVEAQGTKFSLPAGTTGLYPTAPNASGDVAGTYLTSGREYSHSYGFLRLADGTFTTIDVKRSFRHNTSVEAIDDNDTVVGQYEDENNPDIDHAFVRTADGTLTRFDAPDAYDTFPSDVNAGAGEIVGWYYAADGNHGFVRKKDGKLATIDDPGASGGTYPYAVNSSGNITGRYVDSGGVDHGFLRNSDGTWQTIDPPGSVYTDNVVINDKGVISGIYQDGGNGMLYGFVLDHGTYYPYTDYFSRLNAHRHAVGQTFRLAFRDGNFTTKPVAPPKRCSNLFLTGINDAGLFSGSMQCGNGRWFGWLASK